MNEHNQIYRKRNRRQQERRSHSRRVIKHEFGSEQWQKAVEAAYTFWPKQDRRVQERRIMSRRIAERRIETHKSRRYSLRQLALRRNGQHQRLTPEERQMLNDLNKHS